MAKYGDKNFKLGLKLFKNTSIKGIEELFCGLEDEEDIENGKEIKNMIREAESFAEVEGILVNEFGLEDDSISDYYQWTIAELIEMKKKDLFVEAI